MLYQTLGPQLACTNITQPAELWATHKQGHTVVSGKILS